MPSTLSWLVLQRWYPIQCLADSEYQQKGQRVHGFHRLWVLVKVWWLAGTCKGLAKYFLPEDNFRSWRSVYVLWNWKTFPTSCAWMHTVPESSLYNGSRPGCPQLPLPSHTLVSVQRKPAEGGRELQHSLTSVLIVLAGLQPLPHPIRDYTALHCSRLGSAV